MAGLAVLFAAALSWTCGKVPGVIDTSSGQSRSELRAKSMLASGPFRMIEFEDHYLNGAENDDRPAIWYLLIGSSLPGSVTEDELAVAYAEALRREGRQVERYSTNKDWWEFYGGVGSPGSIRIGSAARFIVLATADEGYARPKFRRVVSRLNEPLIVVSIDPLD